MSRAFSSKKSSTLPPPPTPITVASSCAKKKPSPRSPLQDLNRISSSSNSSYASSSVSTEAPKGCLRFLSSSSFRTPVHRPKSLTKTPSSVPHAVALKQSKSNSSKENLPKGNSGIRTKTLASDKAQTRRKKPPCLYQWQPGKKSWSMTGQKSKPCSALNEHGKLLPRLPSASKELKHKEDILGGLNDNACEHAHLKLCLGDVNSTPSKKVIGSYLGDVRVFEDVEENPNASISRTPPIHDSVSPEIQCGSSLVSKTTTPACYGAGYVVSGVADKRKCRPRGILTVERYYSGCDKLTANSSDDDEKKVMDTDDHASPSLLPLPTEAVVRWLSSPSNKGKKNPSQKFEHGLNQSQGLGESTTLASSTSLSSSSKTFWNVSDSSDLSCGADGIMRKISSLISPSGLAEFQVPSNYKLSPSYSSLLFSPNPTPICRAGSSGKSKRDRYNLIDENSPFSLNSFGSQNVIQTPESDCSSYLHVGLSLVHTDNLKGDDSNPDLNKSSKMLLSENFLNSSILLEDSVNSSFQFDCLTVPHESIDLSKHPNFLDDQDPWLSSSTTENASQSQMRVSWREGLMSQLYELDEFDCCRCLSDEEEIANDSGTDRFSGPQVNVETNDGKKLNSDVGITETEDNELEIDGLGKDNISALISCSGAESISTDGGGLVASGEDPDWTLCHVNKLFEV
ncbi:uncharacterized protein LOC109805375 isoform X2 [Cajanus cajan]|nr:uncharacterized protein LOC109805375 isoform X2 [Cajanus cajan]XP_020223022.1 uncharacterized protein LOC109805375 isoform X2 [Cajanus cajan]XP_020223023.1 uncharacterized protein LOC109805375 isoform X2 [Cajanus cajan]XP_029128580.1 uncharacterized protein LOC109805375 isoform X2 [Cajanus cajan]